MARGGMGPAGGTTPAAAPRASDEHAVKAFTPVWDNSSLGKAALSTPNEDRPPSPDFYRPPAYSTLLTSSPPGRAPPTDS